MKLSHILAYFGGMAIGYGTSVTGAGLLPSTGWFILSIIIMFIGGIVNVKEDQ